MFRKDLIVLPECEFADKFEIIHYMTHLNNESVKDADGYENDVRDRESVVPTYIGFEIAIPHARTPYVKEPFVVYAKLKNPVNWGENENETVSQIFLLGVPSDDEKSAANLHMRILSQLSRNLMHEEFRESLKNGESAESIYEVLKQIEEGINL